MLTIRNAVAHQGCAARRTSGKNRARGFVFRIVFNWRRQCPILAHSARCSSLIRRWPRGRLQLPKVDVADRIPPVVNQSCSPLCRAAFANASTSFRNSSWLCLCMKFSVAILSVSIMVAMSDDATSAFVISCKR